MAVIPLLGPALQLARHFQKKPDQKVGAIRQGPVSVLRAQALKK